MSEVAPLLNHKSDGPRYNVASETKGEEREPSVYEGEYEIPLLEIVTAVVSAWERYSATENLTSETLMAMHLAYRRVTGGREVLHAQYAIMNELADAMLNSMRQRQILSDGLCAIPLRCSILRNLRESWPSIVNFDEDVAIDLNAYHPPTFQERIRNFWMNRERSYTAVESFFSEFTGQLLITLILLSWPLSLLIMGLKFLSQCTISNFLHLYAMVATGFMGLSVLLLRLTLACIEKWYWFPVRENISSLWNFLRFMEFAFVLVLNIQLWYFLRLVPRFESEDPEFCNETFHSFTLSMTYISTAFGLIWLAVNFVKAVSWTMRRRYHYLPLFDDFS